MKYKVVLTIIVVMVMAMSVSAAVPIASGNNVQQSAVSGNSGSSGIFGSGNLNASFNSSINAHFKDMHNYGAHLTYNATTGKISGRFLTANFKSGVFSNITYNMTSTELISKMYANGTSPFGMHMSLTNFFQGTNVIGNLFMYTNTSSFFVMHNNPAIETNMLVYKGTIHIYIPSNATIYNTSRNMQVTYSANARLNAQVNNSTTNSNFALNTMINFNNIINAGRQMIIIDNNGTIAMLFVHNGYFNVTGHEISIRSGTSGTSGPVFVNMVVPPGMQRVSDNKTVMRGIMKGIVSSEIDLNMVNGTLKNSTIYYNSSIHMVFTGKTSSTVSFDVNSSVNHHTIVAIFIGNNVTRNTGHEYLKFDGTIVSYVSVSALMNETSSTHAYYSYVNSSSGMYVLLYIPHFSNHTVSVSDVPFKTVNNYTEYYIVGGIIAALAIVGVAAYAIKKRK